MLTAEDQSTITRSQSNTYTPFPDLIQNLGAMRLVTLWALSPLVVASPWPHEAYVRAAATLAQLTQDEKVGLASGNNLNYNKGQD